jgi:Zn-dependent M16 (insulinase) family peptidase
LPTITLDDIEREKPVDDMTRTCVEGVDVQWNYQPTNGLVYLQALITAEVPADLLPYVPLFCQVWECFRREIVCYSFFLFVCMFLFVFRL